MPIFNRLPLFSEVNDIVGDFTSIVLLEVDLRASSSFETRAKVLQKQLWQDMDHLTVNAISILREREKQQVAVGQNTMPIVFTSALGVGGLGEDVLPGELAYSITQIPQVWLDHQVYESGSELVLIWDAVEELFPVRILDDMLEAYIDLLVALSQGERWDADSPVCLPEWQLSLRSSTNATSAAYPKSLFKVILSRCFVQFPKTIFKLIQITCLIESKQFVGIGRTQEETVKIFSSRIAFRYEKGTRKKMFSFESSCIMRPCVV